MNLQERLEAMLDQRRAYVLSGRGGEEALRRLLLNEIDFEEFADPEDMAAQEEALTKLAGAILYLLHPDDEAVTGTTDPYENMSEPGPGHLRMAGPFHVVQGLGEDGEPFGLPLPLPAGARVHIIDEAAIWTSDGAGGWDKRPHLEQSTPLYPQGYYAPTVGAP